MAVKVVAFDMGGVMVRSFDTLLPIFAQYHIGKPDQELMYQMLNEMCRGLWSEEDFWRLYAERTGIKIQVPEGGWLLRGFEPRLDQETVDLVFHLKQAGYRVVCATNTISIHYAWHIAHGQYAMFDKVYASHLMHEVKPEAGFYKAVVAGEGVQAGEVFFCDDNQINVDGARKCGLYAERYVSAGQIAGALRELGLKFSFPK